MYTMVPVLGTSCSCQPKSLTFSWPFFAPGRTLTWKSLCFSACGAAGVSRAVSAPCTFQSCWWWGLHHFLPAAPCASVTGCQQLWFCNFVWFLKHEERPWKVCDFFFLFLATLTYDTLRFEYEDFPETKEPVWILGRKYSVFTGILPAWCNLL